MSINRLRKIDIKSILSVGLDVSKRKIDVCFASSNGNTFLQISNSKKGLLEFIDLLEEISFPKANPLIIESTGDYNTLACLLFSEAKFNIKEINPIMTKSYIKSTIRGTKTDKTDAKVLANIGIINKNELFTYTKSKTFIAMSKKVSLVATLETQIQSLKRTLKSFNEVGMNLGIEMSENVENIEISLQELESNLKQLQLEIEEESLGEEHDKKVDILNSITGVSMYMAKVFYVSFAYKNFISKKAMYAFVGYDPRLKDSGNTNGKAYISKRGNPYVRKKLFQAAFGGVRHCKGFTDIYERTKSKGKHHFVCIINVIKKMIHIMFSLLKNNMPFNPNFGTF